MSERDRETIDKNIGRLLKLVDGEERAQAEAILALLAVALRDLNRIADAISAPK